MWDFITKLILPLINIFIISYVAWNGFKFETKNFSVESYPLKRFVRK